MYLPEGNQRGVIHLLGLLLILLLAGGVIAGVYLTGNQQLFFGRADSGAVPKAEACPNIAQDKSKDLLKNGDFSGGLSNWTKFGNANIDANSTVETIDGPNLQVTGAGNFSGGVYQTVTGLTPGKWYHAFFATAQKLPDTDEKINKIPPTSREVGVDVSGGTNPNSGVEWGRLAGGEPDKAAGKYGSWHTLENGNNPLKTFKAAGDKATIFLKISGANGMTGSTTWVDGAYLVPDCGSGQTTTQTTGGSSGGSSGSSTGTSNGYSSTGVAAACDGTKVKLSIEPSGAKVGDTVTLNMTNTGGEGTTKISDELVGLSSCTENFGLGQNFDAPNFWPKVAKYMTCKVTAAQYKWTHKWTNCTPNDQSCSTGNACSKSFDSASGEEKVSAPATGGSTGGSSVSSTPTNVTAVDIKNKFGIMMSGFDSQRLSWAYSALELASKTKFIDLVKGASVVSSQGNATPLECTQEPIQLQQVPDEALFRHALLHELSHRLHSCQTDPASKRTKHDQVYQAEGGITSYAVCGQSPGGQINYRNEDYAEMLSYYIDINSKEIGSIPACNINNGANPFAGGKFPQHAALAKEIVGK